MSALQDDFDTAFWEQQALAQHLLAISDP